MRTYGARAFAISTTELWNQLPDDIKSIANLTTFKSKLKTYRFFNIAFKNFFLKSKFHFFHFYFLHCVNIV